MKKVQKIKTAGSVVAATFLGAFASRWIDNALATPFPFSMILLLVIGVILFILVYIFAGKMLN